MVMLIDLAASEVEAVLVFDNLVVGYWPLALGYSKTGFNSGVTLRKSFKFGVGRGYPLLIAGIARDRNGKTGSPPRMDAGRR